MNPYGSGSNHLHGYSGQHFIHVKIVIIQPPTELNKLIRTALRTRRRSQSVTTIQKKSEAVAQHIRSYVRKSELQMVAGYRAQEGEVVLESVFETLFRLRIEALVPIVRGRTMRFSLIEPMTQFNPGTFGIEEPTTLKLVDSTKIDMVLAPLVAFSSSGYRLGRGGGYYDKVFIENTRTKLVGVGYDFQQSDEFVPHVRDKPLDAVVTESGWREFATNRSLCNEEVNIGR